LWWWLVDYNIFFFFILMFLIYFLFFGNRFVGKLISRSGSPRDPPFLGVGALPAPKNQVFTHFTYYVSNLSFITIYACERVSAFLTQ
jgi:hypothetical protein